MAIRKSIRPSDLHPPPYTNPPRQRQDNRWAILGRWVLACVVALGLSAQVEARDFALQVNCSKK